MALGKKSTTIPEIGDLVTVKIERAFVFDDKDQSGIPSEYPKNANLGVLQAIEENSEGKTMYQVDNGWIAADEVTTKVNPKYSYPNTTANGGSTTPKKDNSAFWTAISSIATGIFGIFGGKKTSTSEAGGSDTAENTDTSGKDTGEGTSGGDAPKKTTPTWVYLSVGGVVVVGIIAALLWPKKKEPTPPQPIVL